MSRKIRCAISLLDKESKSHAGSGMYERALGQENEVYGSYESNHEEGYLHHGFPLCEP
eukprot:CAMPEP_0184349590 /NCGR_PEP_ID=MMETSP1089-20130417/34822_1 /TAXON_ID=38269 ORGANISM="Gloeochaete wittrockiana, Strain SAG46.84" /NCGR_SAMPLE_ID=MMETSP1089 /ASSEMBLY_ACC=CAM_ASM_000445 /LENGTH=57 /DNA_ID=CAMNT_0026681881 /DNA_START=264 /DNA_END=433 /DNA_ORIENTATION=-